MRFPSKDDSGTNMKEAIHSLSFLAIAKDLSPQVEKAVSKDFLEESFQFL